MSSMSPDTVPTVTSLPTGTETCSEPERLLAVHLDRAVVADLADRVRADADIVAFLGRDDDRAGDGMEPHPGRHRAIVASGRRRATSRSSRRGWPRPPSVAPMRERRPTATSNFGVGRRESHDATAFYERFEPPELSTDDDVPPPKRSPSRSCWATRATWTRSTTARSRSSSRRRRTSRASSTRRSSSATACPSSYVEYLQLLTDVFAECARKLEPGGRIAVNVANLGRKPYRILSADVITILQDDLGLLLRGEVIWRKGEGASGSARGARSAARPTPCCATSPSGW